MLEVTHYMNVCVCVSPNEGEKFKIHKYVLDVFDFFALTIVKWKKYFFHFAYC